MNLLHRPVSAIRLAPLIAVEFGLALAAAPLFGRMAPWVVALFFATCGARLLMNRDGARLPSLPLKVVFFGVGTGGIALTYGTAIGIEPGLWAAPTKPWCASTRRAAKAALPILWKQNMASNCRAGCKSNSQKSCN